MKPCSVVLETFPAGYYVPGYFDALASSAGLIREVWYSSYENTVFNNLLRERPHCWRPLAELRRRIDVMESKAEKGNHVVEADVNSTINTLSALPNRNNNKRRLGRDNTLYYTVEKLNNRVISDSTLLNATDYSLAKEHNHDSLHRSDIHSRYRILRTTTPPPFNPEEEAKKEADPYYWCLEDNLCRSCARGADGVVVNIKYLKSVIEGALKKRNKCLRQHPFL